MSGDTTVKKPSSPGRTKPVASVKWVDHRPHRLSAAAPPVAVPTLHAPLVSSSSSSSLTTTTASGHTQSARDSEKATKPSLPPRSVSEELSALPSAVPHSRSAPVSPKRHHSKKSSKRAIQEAPAHAPLVATEVVTPQSIWDYFKLTPAQVMCPGCHMDMAVSPIGYWKERNELILGCGNVIIDKKVPPGFRICGRQWTPSEHTPQCICGDFGLRVECHYGTFLYVCDNCHVASCESRRGHDNVSTDH